MLVDASWDTTGRAGVAVVVYASSDNLIEVRASAVRANDPFHVEAMALQEAISTGGMSGHDEE